MGEDGDLDDDDEVVNRNDSVHACDPFCDCDNDGAYSCITVASVTRRAIAIAAMIP